MISLEQKSVNGTSEDPLQRIHSLDRKLEGPAQRTKLTAPSLRMSFFPSDDNRTTFSPQFVHSIKYVPAAHFQVPTMPLLWRAVPSGRKIVSSCPKITFHQPTDVHVPAMLPHFEVSSVLRLL